MTQFRPLLASDEGSAVVGFAFAAPAIALIATYVIGFMSYVWSRELAVDLIRVELRKVAIQELQPSIALSDIRQQMVNRGWNASGLSIIRQRVGSSFVYVFDGNVELVSNLPFPSVSISEAILDEAT